MDWSFCYYFLCVYICVPLSGDSHGTPSSSSFRLYQVVKLLYCFGIFITFALQFYVAAEIIIPWIVARMSERWERPINFLVRTFLVVVTCKRGMKPSGSFLNLISQMCT